MSDREDDPSAWLGTFAAKVGNELNNPLSAVQSANQYLRRRIEGDGSLARDAKVARFLDIVDAELRTMSRMVSDLIDFGAPRPVIRSSFLLRDLANEVAESLSWRAGVTFENGVGETMAPVYLDRQKCERALTHLVLNAIEAIAPDRDGKVSIRASSVRDPARRRVRLVVQDDGQGIAPADLPKVRDALFGTKVKGAGLGLTIAEALVRAQGGSLELDSTVGTGTRVVLDLPDE